MTKNSYILKEMKDRQQGETVDYRPKQVWPIQDSDGKVRTMEDDHAHYMKYFHSKEREEFLNSINDGSDFDAEKLKAENHERQKNHNIEDIIDFVVHDFYMKIRGIYENNENYSIFSAIEDAYGLIICNNYASYPANILDSLEYREYALKNKKEMN